MKRLIKAFTLCLAGSSLLMGVQAGADECCRDDSCRWDGCWTLGAELLYWRPCVCAWTYGTLRKTPLVEVTTTANNSSTEMDVHTVKMLTVKSDADFGFRIFGRYESCDGCKFTSLSWTHLRDKNAAHVQRNADQTLIVGPFRNVDVTISDVTFTTTLNSSEARLKYEYNRAVLRYGHYVYMCGCVNFYTYAGVEFIEIDRKERLDVEGEAQVDEGALGPWQGKLGHKAEYYSGGLELGVGGEYDLGCGVSVSGRVAGIATVGRRKARYDVLFKGEGEAFLITRYPSHVHCVPGIDVRLGLNYAKECGCTEFLVEIGYELNHYFGALRVIDTNQIYEDEKIANQSFPLPARAPCVDVGFGGPYLSFQLRF